MTGKPEIMAKIRQSSGLPTTRKLPGLIVVTFRKSPKPISNNDPRRLVILKGIRSMFVGIGLTGAADRNGSLC